MDLDSFHTDEFIFKLTHDRAVDWLLPGVPPTGKVLEIPMMGVINIRGDRLYHGEHLCWNLLPFLRRYNLEHIWWDQATALLQAGILPNYVPHSTPEGQKKLRLPVAGVESARLLVNEMDRESNEMFGSDWGVQDV